MPEIVNTSFKTLIKFQIKKISPISADMFILDLNCYQAMLMIKYLTNNINNKRIDKYTDSHQMISS